MHIARARARMTRACSYICSDPPISLYFRIGPLYCTSNKSPIGPFFLHIANLFTYILYPALSSLSFILPPLCAPTIPVYSLFLPSCSPSLSRACNPVPRLVSIFLPLFHNARPDPDVFQHPPAAYLHWYLSHHPPSKSCRNISTDWQRKM